MIGLGISAVEWFRPLVGSKAWDYVVVWKYGDDPTRFIEWMGCCCCGGSNEEFVNIEEEKSEEEYLLSPVCRDSYLQHPVRTRACEALSQLPYTMPLYSGAHGDVAIAKQPRWLIQDSIGTQVLIPITGGLVELFTPKLIPEDTRIMEFIAAHYCISLNKEALSAQSCNVLKEHIASEEYYPTLHVASLNQCSSYPSIEGSSSGTNPSYEQHPSFDSKLVDLNQHEAVRELVNKSIGSKTETSKKQQQRGNMEEDKSEIREPQKEGFTSKNLVTERNRRNRIKDALFTLRSLVPRITRMDRAAILGDAIDYMKELKEQVKELQDEIKDLEEDCERKTPQSRREIEKEGGTKSLKSPTDCIKKNQMEVQVEVNQIGQREFLIKVYCEMKRGGFARLMEALHSFGLQVTNAYVNTFDGRVQNILTVEENKQDIIHPKILKEKLLDLLSMKEKVIKKRSPDPLKFIG